MSTAYWLQGDTRTVLADMAAAGIIVDVVVTSPPFLNLRSYLPAGDPDKAFEIGSETDPGQFIDTLLDVTEACEQILAPHGSIAVELGDTYAGSGGAGGDYAEGGLRDSQQSYDGSAAKARRNAARETGKPDGGSWRDRQLDEELGIRPIENRWRGERPGWPADKSLSLIPELYRTALAYGINPLRPIGALPPHRHPAWSLPNRPTTRWRIRNSVTWCRPNPPVGRDGDKFRPATSDLVIACRTDEAGRRRYWDGDAVRHANPRSHQTYGSSLNRGNAGHHTEDKSAFPQNPAGAPLLDWWKLSGAGYDGAHYATFPPKLVEPLIKAMCPERVCTVCGEPSKRIVEQHYEPDGNERMSGPTLVAAHRTVGWTSCGHDAWRPGIVLDPFAGSGTTLMVATGHGRDAIGIDLDSRNVDLARDRVGPLFFAETTVPELADVLGPRAQSGSAA